MLQLLRCRPGAICIAHATHSVMQIPEDSLFFLVFVRAKSVGYIAHAG